VYPEYVTTIVYVCWLDIAPEFTVQLWMGFPLPSVVAMQFTTPGTATLFCSGVSVTSAEMFCWPEVVTPMIVNCAALVPLAVIPADAGVIVIEETVSATVAVVVPVIDPEEAVMVDVPAETPVSMPPVVTVATAGSELDQQTVLPVQLVPPFRVLLLPSLKVAAAVSCSEAAPLPKPTDGLGGSMVMEETVGFWKNPLQLTARASVASAAKAPARRSLFFVDDMVIRRLLGRACFP
jgi:hypothetical protein